MHYGKRPYTDELKDVEQDIDRVNKAVKELCGVKESDTGLAPPSQWDIPAGAPYLPVVFVGRARWKCALEVFVESVRWKCALDVFVGSARWTRSTRVVLALGSV